MPLSDSARASLGALLGQRFTMSSGACMAHATDISHHEPLPPDAVVFATGVGEVQEIVRICAATRTPIIPYGAGTSVEGNIHAVRGGVTLDLSRMDRIIKVNEADLDVVVEPGVRRESLNDYLRDTGLFFPIDPGANATLGGMAATRASGTNAVRYGTMRENVLALEVVTPTGLIIRTARRARKSAAGYDLTRLFVGSEGTLGVITELTLRLYGLPEQILSATCAFATTSGAIDCVIQLIQLGIPVARVEFLDSAALRAVNKASRLGLPEEPCLFFEFHGSNAAVAEQASVAQQIAREQGGHEFRSATSPESRSALWKARHRLALSVASYAVGTRQRWTDVCVPISKLSACIVETQRDIESSGLFAPILGHVGDGNFHVGICVREGDAGQLAAAEHLHHRMVQRAIEHDGTCTGEHGIGRGKLRYLEQELGEAVGLMRSVKSALDPLEIMNPGKVLA